ncbi:hypothetical protein [[Phormidium ambiguum] IAM M-71]|uniref:hypothetical protein n=1 Tax=[Phormidium ambiguum] IAM M-71 TaxID=454136 RepID=UPI001F446101|nr:hypothetical protein [Phormidium ambiguum]
MNKHQKEWLAQFFSRHPDYKVSQPSGIIRLAAGGISITFERTEWIYLEPISAQYSGEYLPGFKWHYITARLSKKAELLSDITYSCKVASYPHCPLKAGELDQYELEKIKIKQGEQLNLPFHLVVLTVNRPPLLKGGFYRTKRRYRSRKGGAKKPRYTSKSFQRELPFLKPKILAPDTQFVNLTCSDDAVIQVPEYLMKLLEEANASLSEKEDAADLYAIAGLHAAINFVKGLPFLRARATNIHRTRI